MNVNMAPWLPRHYSPQPQQPHPLPSSNLHSQAHHSAPPAPPAKTLILTHHPAARLSSSPASSPRVVDSPPERTRSIRPEMIHLMEEGTRPGADFFENSSADDDGSEWEDDNGSPKYSHEAGREREREREKERSRRESQCHDGSISHRMALSLKSPVRDPSRSSRETDCASTISLPRPGSPRLLHHDHGFATSGAATPRESMLSRSSDSDENSTPDHPSTPFPNLQDLQDANINMTKIYSQSLVSGRHRRNTSESLRADSILNAHVITMKALEALPSTGSLTPSLTHQRHPRSRAHSLSHHHQPSDSIFTASGGFTFGSTSFSHHHHHHHHPRRVVLSPLNTHTHFPPSGPSRPPASHNQPPHFIKTPYPFSSAKKEFPKPATRPRHHHFVYSDESNNDKGKHILGIAASDSEFDLRARLERNMEAQGIMRSGTIETNTDDEQRPSWRTGEEDLSAREAIIWLTLAKGGRWNRSHCQGATEKVERIVIPPTDSQTSKEKGQRWSSSDKKKKRKKKVFPISEKHKHNFGHLDFDDSHLAHLLRTSYTRLTPPRLARFFSAKKLHSVRLGRVSPWSGTDIHGSNATAGTGRLLMTHANFDMSFTPTHSPLTEQSLTSLFHNPLRGKGKYTWVNWARRVAAHNTPKPNAHMTPTDTNTSTSSNSYLHSHSHPSSEAIVTIHFMQSFSCVRVLGVLAAILVVSITSTLLWTFLGETAWPTGELLDPGRVSRVGAGLVLGVFVLLLQMVGFVAWLGVSWVWL